MQESARTAAVGVAITSDSLTSEAATRALVECHVERVVVGAASLTILLRNGDAAQQNVGADGPPNEIVVPWSGKHRSSRAAVIPSEAANTGRGRARQPMPEDVRRQLLVSIVRARAWTEALANGQVADTAALAERAGCSERHVRMLLPLANMAPDLVEAAVEGRLPAGFGAARLCRGLPSSWAEQRRLIPVITAPQAYLGATTCSLRR